MVKAALWLGDGAQAMWGIGKRRRRCQRAALTTKGAVLRAMDVVSPPSRCASIAARGLPSHDTEYRVSALKIVQVEINNKKYLIIYE